MAVHDITTYGAVSGGPAAANRVAIQAAITAAVDGDEIYVPNGTYETDKSPSGSWSLIVDGKRLHWRGESRAGAILKTVAADAITTTTIWHIVIRNTPAGEPMIIRDLQVDGSKPGSGGVTLYDPLREHHPAFFVGPNVDGITFRNVHLHDQTGDGIQNYLSVSNVILEDSLLQWQQRDGFTLSPTLQTQPVVGVIIRRNTIEGASNQQIDNEHGPAHDVEVYENTITSGTLNPVSIAIAWGGASTTNPSRNWKIHHNVINGALFCVWGHDPWIYENTITSGQHIPGIQFDRSVTRGRIFKNTITATQTTVANNSGIYMSGTAGSGPVDVLVYDNVLDMSTHHASCFGIRADGAVSFTARNNDLTGPGLSATGGAGVRMRATDETRNYIRGEVDNNRITNWGQYGVVIAGSGRAKLLTARIVRNTFVNTAGPMTTAIDCGDANKPAQYVQIGGNILGTGVSTLHVDSAQVALLFQSTLAANVPAGAARGATPLAPLLGHVMAPGSSVQHAAGQALRYDAADAVRTLRAWRSLADVQRDGLPPCETLYPLQEASGATVTDVMLGQTLVATGNARVGRRCHGIFDGQSFHGRRGVELADAAAIGAITASTSTDHLYGSESFAILVVFRALFPPTATAAILGTRDGAAAGYRLEINTSGRLQLVIGDGSATVTITESGTHRVTWGGWGWALVVVNRTAGTATLSSSFATAPASASIAGLSSIAGATAFRLGNTTASPTHRRCQIERLVTWRRSEAEAMTPGHLTAWWNHGTHLPWITEYTWTSKGLAPTIEEDDGIGSVLAPWSPGQLALARDATITRNARKVGFLITRGIQARNTITNLANAGWAATTATKTVADRTDPLGFRDGVRVTKSGAGGKIVRAIDILAAGEVTAAVWVWWDGTSAPRIRIRDSGDTTTLAEATYAGPAGRWARFSVTWTSAGGADRIELHPSDPAVATGIAWFSHCQANSGERPIPLQPGDGEVGSTGATTMRSIARGARAGRGSMRAWWTALVQDVANASQGGAVASLSASSSTNVHRRAISVLDTTEEGRGRAWNGAGALTTTALIAAPADWATAESEMTLRWDEAEVDGYSVRVDRNGVGGVSGADLGAPGETLIESLSIGCEPGTGRSLHGILSLLEVWPGHVIPVP